MYIGHVDIWTERRPNGRQKKSVEVSLLLENVKLKGLRKTYRRNYQIHSTQNNYFLDGQ